MNKQGMMSSFRNSNVKMPQARWDNLGFDNDVLCIYLIPCTLPVF
jgi:hypothetical protein